jgi:putative ABC transport system permease protein
MSVPLTRRNIFHERGKLALSVSSVAASLALILLLLGFREGLYATLTAYVDNIGADLIVAQSGVQGMFSSNSAVSLNLHDNAVAAASATEAGHILLADVIFTRGEVKTPVLLVGYDPETTFGSPWKIGSGSFLTGDDEIMIDTWLAKRSGINLGDGVELLGQEFEVIGLTRETSSWMSPYVFVSLNAAETALGLSGIVSYHLLRLPDGMDVDAAARAVENEVPGVDAMIPDEIAEADRRVLANIMDTPINVMLIIGVVIGIAVMSLTSYTAVTDQTREYGVLKAVGANGSQLARLVTTETLARSGLGYVFGIGLSYLAAFLIMTIWPQFNILIRLEAVARVGILALVMSLIAALLPIRRLNKIDPLVVFKS